MSGKKVAICMPHGDVMPSGTAFDLAAMSAYYTHQHGYENYAFIAQAHSILPAGRQRLAEIALKENIDYILWVDSDMRFPKDALHRLLKHDKDIVGCNYSTRKQYAMLRPTAFKELPDGEPVLCHTRPDSAGLEEVAGCGMGFMLMKTEILRKIPKPWFMFMYSTVNEMFHGEDLFFLQRAAVHANAKVYIDHDLSKLIGHTGQFVYTLDHVEVVRSELLPEAAD